MNKKLTVILFSVLLSVALAVVLAFSFASGEKSFPEQGGEALPSPTPSAPVEEPSFPL